MRCETDSEIRFPAHAWQISSFVCELNLRLSLYSLLWLLFSNCHLSSMELPGFIFCPVLREAVSAIPKETHSEEGIAKGPLPQESSPACEEHSAIATRNPSRINCESYLIVATLHQIR